MAAKSQLKVTANVSYPRSDDIDGTDSKTARHTTLTRGQTLTVGQDVSKARADWLLQKGYANKLTTKGEEVNAEGEPVSPKSDEAVEKATREGSQENTDAAGEVPVEDAPDESSGTTTATGRAGRSGRRS